jgi:hypothetical protein
MPHRAQRSVPQVAVHIIVDRVEPQQDRHRHMPHMVQVTTVQLPIPLAFPLVHRASHLHSRYIHIYHNTFVLCYVTDYFCITIVSFLFHSDPELIYTYVIYM